MRTFLLISLLALGHQQIPKNNPNGVWRAESGLEFELRLVGADVHARMVAGSNPRYLEYEIDLIGTEEPNTYKGTGHFKARLANGRECEFHTDWHIVVVSEDRSVEKNGIDRFRP